MFSLSQSPTAVNDDNMCLILFSYLEHSGYRLILAANRDEFYDRPTQPLHVWDDAPDVWAGRDLKGRGTWLGISRRGRLAAITNYRDPANRLDKAPSRGLLVSRFLTGQAPPESYLHKVNAIGHRYNGFNLIAGDATGLWYLSNRRDGIQRLRPGLYGLSNHLIDTAWPKVSRGKKRLRQILNQKDGWDPEEIFSFLEDRTIYPDSRLPDTGVGLDWERTLSPLFITSPAYGTRSSSVITIADSGEAAFVERSFSSGSSGMSVSETRHARFMIQADSAHP